MRTEIEQEVDVVYGDVDSNSRKGWTGEGSDWALGMLAVMEALAEDEEVTQRER